MQLNRSDIAYRINGELKGTRFDNVHYAAMSYFGKEYYGGKYLEVGTNLGRSAFRAWTDMKPKEMVLVDLFKNNLKKILMTFVAIKCKSEIKILKGDSHNILPTIDDKYDLILVDGDHTREGLTKDLVDCYRLLKEGGTMLADDILPPWNLEGVCDNFAKEFPLKEYNKRTGWDHGVAIFRK